MRMQTHPALSRRRLLQMIGLTAGTAAMYQAMTALGLAAESGFKGPVKLDGDPKGASVLILGAGLAGMLAALEMRQTGYNVKVLEYNARAGGRTWTIRGGDIIEELGGFKQHCEFDEGLYLNPGPWRIPYHHNGLLYYCRRLGVQLEPFQQLNHNALLHSTKAFGGKPQRVREVKTDFQGHISEMLAKVVQKGKLEEGVAKEDQEKLLDALRSWGALDKDYAYAQGAVSAEFRGYAKDPGGGLGAEPVHARPLAFNELLRSALWKSLANFALYEFQTTMFQPVGGMGRIGDAFAKEVKDLITFDAKVVKIEQDEKGVTVSYVDAKMPRETRTESADWCVCTIPLTILSQIDIQVSDRMKAAISAVPYAASVKVGLQMKRRFWEEDDLIFGGVSYTDLPITQISYPSTDFNKGGKGVLLGCYTWNGPDSYAFASMSPKDRVKAAVAQGSVIHPQYSDEFENGVSWAWHRSPFTLGCAGDWTEEARNQHYDNLCQIDGRIVLAGEHASYVPAWQEGAILSSIDAIERLHKRVIQG